MWERCVQFEILLNHEETKVTLVTEINNNVMSKDMNLRVCDV